MTDLHFAGYLRRAVALIVDFCVLLFLVFGLHIWILEPLGLSVADDRLIFFVLGFAYFTLSWTSPLKGSPAQWLTRICVTNTSGYALTPARAAGRAALIVIGLMAGMAMANVPETPAYLAVVALSVSMFLAAAVTNNRQGLHDMMVGSIVVLRKAIRAEDNRSELEAVVTSNDDPATPRLRVNLATAGAVVVTFVPLFALYSAAVMQFDRELRYRIDYAIRETAGLRTALYEVHQSEGYWTMAPQELGVAIRGDYPDGGYYELEANGEIRIRFTVIPKLKRIAVIMSPAMDDGAVKWVCRVEGDIAPGILPPDCRD